jgi:hypothetical protein
LRQSRDTAAPDSPYVCYEAQTNDVPTKDEDEATETERAVSPSAFNLDGPTSGEQRMQQIIVEDKEDKQPTNVAAEFLSYHQKFNHVSPKKIQAMAKRGMLPRRLFTCPVPLCTACLYGKAKKRAWRSKPSDIDEVRLMDEVRLNACQLTSSPC